MWRIFVKLYCMEAWFCHIIKVFRFQRKTLLFLLGFFFPIIIIFFFLTVFVPRISRKRLDRFSWNFHTWYLMIKCYYTFFCFDDVTSSFEKSPFSNFLKKYKRYEAEILSISRQGIIILPVSISYLYL